MTTNRFQSSVHPDGKHLRPRRHARSTFRFPSTSKWLAFGQALLGLWILVQSPCYASSQGSRGAYAPDAWPSYPGRRYAVRSGSSQSADYRRSYATTMPTARVLAVSAKSQGVAAVGGKSYGSTVTGECRVTISTSAPSVHTLETCLAAHGLR